MPVYRRLVPIWRPAAYIVRFVIVSHLNRGTIFLISTELTLHRESGVAAIRIGYRKRTSVLT
jgi:hypothetical protein